MATKQPKLLQGNKLLRSSIITLIGLAILVTVIYWNGSFFEEIQSVGLSLGFTQFLFPIYQFFLSIYKYYVLVFIINLVLCIDIWRRTIHTQEYLKRAFILLQVIRFLEYAMWLLFLLVIFNMNICIVEGEKILTPSGTVVVQDILIGDEVWTFSSEEKLEIGKVTAIKKFQTKAFFKISLVNGQELNITGTHPIATATGWKQAKEIIKGDLVQIIVNDFSEVFSIRIVPQKVNIYAISVDTNENFFVNSILVHNKSSI